MLRVPASIREHILDFIFPKRCLICGRFNAWLCDRCQARVRFKTEQRCVVCEQPSVSGATHPGCRSTATLDGLLAAGHFKQLQPLLHAYKYLLVKELSRPLTDVYVKFIHASGLRYFLRNALLVPVPLHPRRRRYRGFNQSALLAARLAQRLSLRYDASLLIRQRWTVPQVTLDKPRRKHNMQNTFRIAPEAITVVAGEPVVLLDDIATTGATLNACAQLLKAAGAASVWGLVLAHG